MRTVLAIGHNDLRLFLRNRASFVWLFVMPLVFVYFMGFANRGPGGPASPRPAVRVENADAGFLGGVFLGILGEQGLAVVTGTNGASARRGIRIPAEFTAEVTSGRQGKIDFFTIEGTENAASVLVEIRVLRALIALNSQLLEWATANGGTAPTGAGLEALRARADPVVLVSTHAGRKPIPTGFSFSLPGVLVMYLMMNLLIFGATSVAWERRSGVLRRVAVHPVSRAGYVAGKLYGLVLLAGVQVLFLLVCGRVLFQVNMGESWFGILVALLIYAWMAASFGLAVGLWVRAEERVVGLCVLATMVMAALGGCWWPLEIVPDWVKTLAHFFPTAWAMDALHRLISFGDGLDAILRELGVLLLFGLVANAAAVRAYRV